MPFRICKGGNQKTSRFVKIVVNLGYPELITGLVLRVPFKIKGRSLVAPLKLKGAHWTPLKELKGGLIGH